MKGYEYAESVMAGALVANFVPHFVQGILGRRFPTPFAKPPGRGLSSPTVNVVWGLANLAAGLVLFRMGDVSGGGLLGLGVFVGGMAAVSVPMSLHFGRQGKE